MSNALTQLRVDLAAYMTATGWIGDSSAWVDGLDEDEVLDVAETLINAAVAQ